MLDLMPVPKSYSILLSVDPIFVLENAFGPSKFIACHIPLSISDIPVLRYYR